MPTRRMFLGAVAAAAAAKKIRLTRPKLPTPALLLDLDAFNANVD